MHLPMHYTNYANSRTYITDKAAESMSDKNKASDNADATAAAPA